MGIIGLNTIGIDGNVFIKKGGGNSGGGGSTPKWTGHADAEGLKAIGWTDEDIAYYQATGVNWNEEDDEWHKVTDDNKALYGVLTASNISTYKDRIVYLPKIDMSGVTSMYQMFQNCRNLIAIPILNTSRVKSMNSAFDGCYSLTSVPMLDTSIATSASAMFKYCYSLTSIPMLNTSKMTYIDSMFYNCYSLTSIPMLDTSRATSMSSMFYNCYSLTSIPQLDMNSVRSVDNMFQNCSSLIHANFKNVKSSYIFPFKLLTKASLLYIINNEAATSAITITLASYAYDKWANDPDIVAALANHPNISLAK